MKKRTLLLTLFIAYLIVSCSSNTTDGNSDTITNDNHLVKKEIIHSNAYIEYRYNENNLLIQIDDVWDEEDIDTHHFYTYDSNENIMVISTNSLNGSNTKTFAYDNNNRLINSISDNYSNRTYTYSDNIITVSNSSNDTHILETNNLGLITKLTSINSHYSLINYDSNKNITEINTFDIDNNLKSTITYTFDDNPNPFYGLLKSIYVHQFLSAFRDVDFGEIVYEGYDGYWFPFLKNNITNVERTIINEFDSTDNYLYEYDENNYPTRVFDSAGGLNESNYYIEYY